VCGLTYCNIYQKRNRRRDLQKLLEQKTIAEKEIQHNRQNIISADNTYIINTAVSSMNILKWHTTVKSEQHNFERATLIPSVSVFKKNY
jgi:predicted Ser/Thr protein kinase